MAFQHVRRDRSKKHASAQTMHEHKNSHRGLSLRAGKRFGEAAVSPERGWNHMLDSPLPSPISPGQLDHRRQIRGEVEESVLLSSPRAGPAGSRWDCDIEQRGEKGRAPLMCQKFPVSFQIARCHPDKNPSGPRQILLSHFKNPGIFFGVCVPEEF